MADELNTLNPGLKLPNQRTKAKFKASMSGDTVGLYFHLANGTPLSACYKIPIFGPADNVEERISLRILPLKILVLHQEKENVNLSSQGLCFMKEIFIRKC